MWTRTPMLLFRCFFRSNSVVVHQLKRSVQTGDPRIDKFLERVTGNRIDQILSTWEDFTKLTPYKEAEAATLQANDLLREARDERRVLQAQQKGIQNRLKEVANQIEKTNRGTNEYVQLVMQESKIFQEDISIQEKITDAEERERRGFESLTHTIYLAHEKGNEHRQHVTIIYLVATVFVTVLTAFYQTIRIYYMNKVIKTAEVTVQECKTILTGVKSNQGEMSSLVSDLRHGLEEKSDLRDNTKGELMQGGVIGRDFSAKLGDTSAESIDTQKIMELLTTVQKQGQAVNSELIEIHKLLKESQTDVQGSSKSVIHVGPEVKDTLGAMEENIAWRLRIHTIASASFFCGAVALTVLAAFLRGS